MADTVNVYFIGHDKLSSVTSKASSGLDSFSKKLTSVGRNMTMGVTLPVVAGFGYAIKESQEAAKALAQTAAVIKSTGGAANVTAKDVTKLADALAKKTAIDDESIQSAENVLLTFKRVKNEVGEGNDIFNQATEAVLDMSTALGQDFQSSAIQLGKALSDPIAGLTALRRVGVTFTQQQKEQAAAAVFFGDTMTAQKIILKEVMEEFGGSAEAAATPLDRLRQKLDDTAEAIGTKAMPIISRFGDVVIDLMNVFLGMPDWAQDFVLGGAAISAAVGPLLRMAGAMGQFVSFIPSVARFFTSMPLWSAPLAAAAVGIGLLVTRATDGEKAFDALAEAANRATDAALLNRWSELVDRLSTFDGLGFNNADKLDAFAQLARQDFDGAVRLFDALKEHGQVAPGMEAALNKEAEAMARAGTAAADSTAATWFQRDAVTAYVSAQQRATGQSMLFTGAVSKSTPIVRDQTGAIIGYNTSLGFIPAVVPTALTNNAAEASGQVDGYKNSIFSTPQSWHTTFSVDVGGALSSLAAIQGAASAAAGAVAGAAAAAAGAAFVPR